MIGAGMTGGMMAGMPGAVTPRRPRPQPRQQVQPQPQRQPTTPSVIGGALSSMANVGADVVTPSKAVPGVQKADEQKIIAFIKKTRPNATREEFAQIATEFGRRLHGQRTQSAEQGRQIEQKRMQGMEKGEKGRDLANKFKNIPIVGGAVDKGIKFGEEINREGIGGTLKNTTAGLMSSALGMGEMMSKGAINQLEKKGSGAGAFLNPVSKALLPQSAQEKIKGAVGDRSVGDVLGEFGQKSGIANKLNTASQKKFGVPFATGKEDFSKFDIGQDENTMAYKGGRLLGDMIQSVDIAIGGVEAVKNLKNPKVKQIIESGKEIMRSKGMPEDKIEEAVEIATKRTRAFKKGKGQKELFQAAKPSTGKLTRKKDLKAVQRTQARANELVVEAGYKPKNTEERYVAHRNTMKKKRKEVEDKLKSAGSDVTIDMSEGGRAIEEYLAKNPAMKTINPTEYKKAKDLADSLKKIGKKDVMYSENMKQLLNSQINNRGNQEISDIMQNASKEVTRNIGKQLDTKLSSIPGEFSNLKKDYGALSDAFEDVMKQNIVNQRKKGLGLTESYSRLEGLGDIINGLGGIVSGKGSASKTLSGVAKIAYGKRLAKLKDADYLVKKGFKKLSKGVKK